MSGTHGARRNRHWGGTHKLLTKRKGNRARAFAFIRDLNS